jgi:hypothetical protein
MKKHIQTGRLRVVPSYLGVKRSGWKPPPLGGHVGEGTGLTARKICKALLRASM